MVLKNKAKYQKRMVHCFGSRGSQVRILVSRLDYQGVTLKDVTPYFFGLQHGLHYRPFIFKITEILRLFFFRKSTADIHAATSSAY